MQFIGSAGRAMFTHPLVDAARRLGGRDVAVPRWRA